METIRPASDSQDGTGELTPADLWCREVAQVETLGSWTRTINA